MRRIFHGFSIRKWLPLCLGWDPRQRGKREIFITEESEDIFCQLGCWLGVILDRCARNATLWNKLKVNICSLQIDWYFIKNVIQASITQVLAFGDAWYRHHCLNSGTVCKKQTCLKGIAQEENQFYMLPVWVVTMGLVFSLVCCTLYISACFSNFWMYIQTAPASKLPIGTILSVSLCWAIYAFILMCFCMSTDIHTTAFNYNHTKSLQL